MDVNWRNDLTLRSNGACRGCIICNGEGCIGQIPGMGGVGNGQTFINNYNCWEDLDIALSDSIPKIGVAPMTGVSENMGNPMTEAEFHNLIVKGAKNASIFSTIGDGTPDFKIKSGADALRKNGVKGVVFFKPYPNNILFERYEWVEDVADICGLDIDSYKIVTMKGKVSLEKKTLPSLLELKKRINSPFIVKGVSSEEDVKLMEELKPDMVVVSNHGGRVDSNQEGIGYSLQKYCDRLKKVCSEVWVDGGVRSLAHLQKAKSLGADRVLIGRPFIQGTIAFGENGISKVLSDFGII